MIKWPLKISILGLPIGWDNDKKKSWNQAIDACIEAHNQWIKENEREMIDMQTGLRHRVVKLGGDDNE